MNPAAIPLALYLHLPWCVRKCPYCDFNSFTATKTPPRARYMDALKRDLDLSRDYAAGRPLGSVFLGGGTPSLFTPGEIAQILDAVRERFDVPAAAEITMEANPGTVECGDPAGYRDAGINRLSIGAQSFSDEALAVLGRVHQAAAIHASFGAARAAGFDNINLDIMYALPGQGVEQALADIDAAVDLGPEHISWYHLTLEPNTVFHARPPAGLPDEAMAADIQDAGSVRLAEAGFAQYEVSAWTQEGRPSAHNLNYWTFGDYLAAGAGAHAKVTTTAGVFRYSRPANPEGYMSSLEAESPSLEPVAVSAPDLAFEFMLNALRLTGGFSLDGFVARTGLPVESIAGKLATLEAQGLIRRLDDGVRIVPSERGFELLNELQAAFLPDAPP